MEHTPQKFAAAASELLAFLASGLLFAAIVIGAFFFLVVAQHPADGAALIAGVAEFYSQATASGAF